MHLTIGSNLLLRPPHSAVRPSPTATCRLDAAQWLIKPSSRNLMSRAGPCQYSRPLQCGRNRRLEHAVRCKASEKASEQKICILGEALFDCLADQKGLSREEVKSWCATPQPCSACTEPSPCDHPLQIRLLVTCICLMLHMPSVLESKKCRCARTPYPGGAPANVACALAQLGSKVVFIGNLGQDDLGDQMADLLASRGIDLSHMHRTSQPTRDVLVTRSLEGDRSFVGFGVAAADAYADCFIDPDKLPERELEVADILVTGTLGLAYPQTAKAMHRAVELARKSPNCAVLIDVNWRPAFFEGQLDTAKDKILPYIAGADVLKVTEEEAEFLFGIPGDDALEHPEQVLEFLPKAKGVLVTAGGRGSAYAFKGSNGQPPLTNRVPVLKVDVLDTTGAGDGFLGGFMHHVIKKGGLDALLSDPEEVRKAVEFGTACGAYVTQGPGDASQTLAVEHYVNVKSDICGFNAEGCLSCKAWTLPGRTSVVCRGHCSAAKGVRHRRLPTQRLEFRGQTRRIFLAGLRYVQLQDRARTPSFLSLAHCFNLMPDLGCAERPSRA